MSGEYVELCKECRDYHPVINNDGTYNSGLCQLLEDCAADPSIVYPDCPCILDRKPDKKISEEQYQQKVEDAREEKVRFREHLEDIAKTIDSWPDWKKKAGNDFIQSLS